MKSLRIGVIGCGGRGNLAKNAHNPEGGVFLAAAADTNPGALATFKAQYGTADDHLFSDYKGLLALKDIDAVFITSPDFLHEEQAVAALQSGKAVYLEKPMAISIEGCDRILRTAFETGSKLYLGHNMRHFPVVLKMKELIDAGAIGTLQAVWCRHFIDYGGDAYFKDWHSERQYANSLLLQKGAHDIDVIHWLSGSYTRSVVGMGKLAVYDQCQRRKPEERSDAAFRKENWPPLSQTGLSPVIDVEDTNSIMMQLENGVQVNYMQCHYTPDNCRNYTFIGTKGRIENIGDYGECQVYQYSSRMGGFNKPDTIHHLFPIQGSHGGADPRIVGEFVRFLREDIPTNTSPVAARYAVAAGIKGAESIRNGSSLCRVPALDQELIRYFENGQVKP